MSNPEISQRDEKIKKIINKSPLLSTYLNKDFYLNYSQEWINQLRSEIGLLDEEMRRSVDKKWVNNILIPITTLSEIAKPLFRKGNDKNEGLYAIVLGGGYQIGDRNEIYFASYQIMDSLETMGGTYPYSDIISTSADGIYYYDTRKNNLRSALLGVMLAGADLKNNT